MFGTTCFPIAGMSEASPGNSARGARQSMSITYCTQAPLISRMGYQGFEFQDPPLFFRHQALSETKAEHTVKAPPGLDQE